MGLNPTQNHTDVVLLLSFDCVIGIEYDVGVLSPVFAAYSYIFFNYLCLMKHLNINVLMNNSITILFLF